MSLSTSASDEQLEAPLKAGKPPIEIGLIVAGAMDHVDQRAIEMVLQRVTQDLERRFSDIAWTVSMVVQREITPEAQEEPVFFLDVGRMERDAHKWDFVFVITSADLIAYTKPFALATVSRTLDVAVISTSRIDPHAFSNSADVDTRTARIADRLGVLLLRCLGHLNGLDAEEGELNLMSETGTVEELDDLSRLTDQQVTKMRANLQDVADLRLEEQTGGRSRSELSFLLEAVWRERREVLAGVWEAEPWQFPIRLTRLTTAAVSAMLVLVMTAETWDMAMSQSIWRIEALLVTVIFLTTAYVVQRQRLLVRRQDRLMTEQIAISNATAVLTVLCGLATTLVCFFVATLILSQTLYSVTLVKGWAASIDGPITFGHYLRLCSVVAGFSLCIGALGASFEDQSYFRHVMFVDEEL